MTAVAGNIAHTGEQTISTGELTGQKYVATWARCQLPDCGCDWKYRRCRLGSKVALSAAWPSLCLTDVRPGITPARPLNWPHRRHLRPDLLMTVFGWKTAYPQE